MAQTQPLIVPVDILNQSPYSGLVAYPNPTPDAVESRVSQLANLGITSLEFEGPLRIGKLSALGKGVVGLVFSGMAGRDHVAVKIRRVDSRRTSMSREAQMMQAANNANIGPEYLGSSRDVLEMQFIEGQSLPSWLSGIKGGGTRARIRATFRELLEQCVRLDSHGIDHGELSRAHKNVLVSAGDHPCILDFESASLMRRVNNFTSIAQYLFLSGRFSRRVLRVLGPVDRDDLVRYLRLYKAGRTNDGFEAVAKMLRL